MPHVFLSYVRDDAKLVDRLSLELERAGIEVWLDREQIEPGSRWEEVISKAIADGAFFIACFSSAYSARKKSYMNEELDLAIKQFQHRPKDQTWFIPVTLNNCEIPDKRIGAIESLRDFQKVSLDKDWLEGINRIISVILTADVVEQLKNDHEMRERALLWKRAKQLMDQLTKPTSIVEDRQYAASELEKISPKVPATIPALQKALTDEDASVRATSARGLAEIGLEAVPTLVHAIRSQDTAVRTIALQKLQEMGSSLTDFVPDLIEALKIKQEAETEVSVSDVLAAIGEATVSPLLKAISDQDGLLIKGAVAALQKIDPTIAVGTVPSLIGLLSHNDYAVRNAAANLIGHFKEKVDGLTVEKAVIPLAEALKEPATRDSAFSALCCFGESASPAIPVLIEILRLRNDNPSSFSSNHDLAGILLVKIGQSTLPALAELVDDRLPIDIPFEEWSSQLIQDWDVRLKARFKALEIIGCILSKHEDLKSQQMLHKLVKDTSEHIWISCKAALILESVGVRTPDMLHVFLEIIKNSAGFDSLSEQAISVLSSFRDDSDQVIQSLVEALKQNADIIREAAAKALGDFGATAEVAIPILTQLLKDENSGVQYAAEEAIKIIVARK